MARASRGWGSLQLRLCQIARMDGSPFARILADLRNRVHGRAHGHQCRLVAERCGARFRHVPLTVSATPCMTVSSTYRFAHDPDMLGTSQSADATVHSHSTHLHLRYLAPVVCSSFH